MKIKMIVCTLALGAALLANTDLSAQETSENAQTKRRDSLELVNEQLRVRKNLDAANMSNLKQEKNDSKTKAKEANRVKNEADDAAKQSKDAYKSERKAQKARKRADAQAKKALKSREKSDQN